MLLLLLLLLRRQLKKLLLVGLVLLCRQVLRGVRMLLLLIDNSFQLWQPDRSCRGDRQRVWR